MVKKRKKKEKRSKIKDFFKKFLKSIFAIVLISSLILAISLLIKGFSNTDSKGFYNILSKLITRNDIKKKEDVKEVSSGTQGSANSKIYTEKNPKGNVVLKICLISDIHQDEESLKKALEKVKQTGCKSIIVIGDITNYGDIESLRKIRNILDNAGIDYYAIPGDHDLAESVSVNNFNNVFGINYHMVEFSGIKFLIVDNSPNFTVMSSVERMWFENNIDKSDFVVLSQPLFTDGLNPPFNSIYMGSMVTVPEDVGMRKMQDSVKESGKEMLDIIEKNKNIKAVFAGEHHRSSEIVDSKRNDLRHYVVGAVTSTINDLPQNLIQTPRFSLLSVYDSGDFVVEDILID